MTPTQDNYLTVAEAQAYAGVSRETIYRWLRTGLLTRYKRGANRTVVDPAEIDELLRPKPADSTG
jgi:excisionase family DNA binding protein